jgi:hypothetical protein
MKRRHQPDAGHPETDERSGKLTGCIMRMNDVDPLLLTETQEREVHPQVKHSAASEDK